MLAATGGNPTAFGILVALHVISAVVGAVAIGLGGIYGGTARHLARPGAVEEARRWFARPNQAALVMLTVPFFGVGAMIADGRSGQLGRLWVVLALCIWLAIAGLLTGVIRPGEAQLRGLLGPPADDAGEGAARNGAGGEGAAGEGAARDGAAGVGAVGEGETATGAVTGTGGAPTDAAASPDAAAITACGRRLSLAATACDLGFIIALGLMIWQP